MPNHFHGIIDITGEISNHVDPRRDAACRVHPPSRVPDHRDGTAARVSGRQAPGSLPALVAAFKSAVTRQVNRLPGTAGTTVWQERYYEHVIRHDDDMQRIRRYISQNLLKWHFDRLFVDDR